MSRKRAYDSDDDMAEAAGAPRSPRSAAAASAAAASADPASPGLGRSVADETPAGAWPAFAAVPAKRPRWQLLRSAHDAAQVSLPTPAGAGAPLALLGSGQAPAAAAAAAAASAAAISPQRSRPGPQTLSALPGNGAARGASQSPAHRNRTAPGPPHGAAAARMGELLQTLDKPQLLNLLVSVMAVHPEAQATAAALMPRPSVESVGQILATHEKQLFDAFPYSKLGPDRSDYAFNRVRPHIEDLRDTILHYLDFFTLPASFPHALQHEYPSTAFAYLHLATGIVHRLPIWQNEARNEETRAALYERLGRHWRIVVGEVGRRAREEGKVFGAYAVGEWARNLHLHSAELNSGFGLGEAFDEFKRQLGWIIGLDADGVRPLGGQGLGFGGFSLGSGGMFLPVDSVPAHASRLFSPSAF